ncbi:ABC transporter permease [Conexibacter stalactiti]|uniref:ABC transporter permease n=1 Tax=Conexibacter stalactiti TaxID=1940611 RepID=A0ABU4HL53_9ACTN|nr:ABC transporter permease [Conexibacter stalactiti]MDW5593444.1 ABC transporter permease [Conexibacter stalactiti]MEC5034085.1 ABC transporter permease [Conexibacter stalactiti]
MSFRPKTLARGLRAEGGALLPVAVLVVMAVVFVVLVGTADQSITSANGYNILQNVALYGWVALALGLTMIAGEFDLSTPAMFTLGGVVAALVGGSPAVAIGAAVAAGIVVGVVQGLLVARLDISSVAVTLAGYIVLSGVALTVSGNEITTHTNLDFGFEIDRPILEVFSVRSLVVLAGFALIGLLLRYTRIGTELRAVGNDRRAARVAGVPIARRVVLVFVLSAVGAAASGALVSYSLSTAAPNVNLEPLIFGVTAIVLGGVSVYGGKGTALGILIGVIALSLLEEGLVLLAIPDYVANIVTGGLLAVVALIAAPDLLRGGVAALRRDRHEGAAGAPVDATGATSR